MSILKTLSLPRKMLMHFSFLVLGLISHPLYANDYDCGCKQLWMYTTIPKTDESTIDPTKIPKPAESPATPTMTQLDVTHFFCQVLHTDELIPDKRMLYVCSKHSTSFYFTLLPNQKGYQVERFKLNGHRQYGRQEKTPARSCINDPAGSCIIL